MFAKKKEQKKLAYTTRRGDFRHNYYRGWYRRTFIFGAASIFRYTFCTPCPPLRILSGRIARGRRGLDIQCVTEDRSHTTVVVSSWKLRGIWGLVTENWNNILGTWHVANCFNLFWRCCFIGSFISPKCSILVATNGLRLTCCTVWKTWLDSELTFMNRRNRWFKITWIEFSPWSTSWITSIPLGLSYCNVIIQFDHQWNIYISEER